MSLVAAQRHVRKEGEMRLLQLAPTAWMALGSLLPVSVAAMPSDFSPPPWNRQGATATFQEWEFTTAPGLVPGGGLNPDGATIGTNNPAATATPAGLAAGLVGGAAAWVGGLAGGTIDFDIPNRPDDLPVKLVRVQIEYGQGDTPPGPLGGFVAVPRSVFSAPATLDVTETDPLRNFRLFTFDIRPNPEFEAFALFVPTGTRIDQVIVDTISTEIPTVSSLMLLGCGVFTFILLARTGLFRRVQPRSVGEGSYG